MAKGNTVTNVKRQPHFNYKFFLVVFFLSHKVLTNFR